MSRPPPTRIRDVSLRAGVSPATVSRAFNAPDTVRPQLRARVQAAADQLGYRPNTSARALRTRRTRSIGVVLPTLLNPVFAECLQGIAQAALADGYAIVPIATDYRIDREAQAVDLLRARGVDGLILCVADAGRSTVLRGLREARIPYVLVYNRHAAHPCVSVDGAAAVSALVERLLALGHRRILMVSGARAASDRARQRQRGYATGMRRAGLTPDLLEVPFMDGATERIAAYLRTRRDAPDGPTAVLCSNDLLAIRCVRAASQVGLRVPHDLSVAGFDGIALGDELTPSLATIVQPSDEIGRRSVHLLMRAVVAGEPMDAEGSVTLPLHFRAGESIAPSATASSFHPPRTSR